METLRTSQTNIEPRFLAIVRKMSEKELRQRVAYLSRYLQNISPKVSVYASLEHERSACQARLAELKKQHG